MGTSQFLPLQRHQFQVPLQSHKVLLPPPESYFAAVKLLDVFVGFRKANGMIEFHRQPVAESKHDSMSVRQLVSGALKRLAKANVAEAHALSEVDFKVTTLTLDCFIGGPEKLETMVVDEGDRVNLKTKLRDLHPLDAAKPWVYLYVQPNFSAKSGHIALHSGSSAIGTTSPLDYFVCFTTEEGLVDVNPAKLPPSASRSRVTVSDLIETAAPTNLILKDSLVYRVNFEATQDATKLQTFINNKANFIQKITPIVLVQPYDASEKNVYLYLKPISALVPSVGFSQLRMDFNLMASHITETHFVKDGATYRVTSDAAEVEKRRCAAVLSLPEGLRWLSQRFNRLFKRDFYDRFIEEQLENFRNPIGLSRKVVMGTPGIGKSSFAVYATWRALKMGKIVVYQHVNELGRYNILNPGLNSMRVYKNDEPPPELQDPSTIYIVDGMTPYGNVEAFTLLVTSPDEKRIHQWKKDSAKLFFIPTWTLDELKLMRTHCYGEMSLSSSGTPVELTDELLLERFHNVGGIPRYIFFDDLYDSFNVDFSLEAQDVANMIKRSQMHKFNLFHTSHCMVHFEVNRDTFQVERLTFASPKAHECALNAMDRSN